MDLVAYLSRLTYAQKLDALEILRQQISQNPTEYPSPEWHGQVIAERLANQSPGPSRTLDVSITEIHKRIHARRSS